LYKSLVNLTPNTTYYFSASAINSAGTSWASSSHFTTLSAAPVISNPYIWVANGDNTVTKLNTAGGSLVGTYPLDIGAVSGGVSSAAVDLAGNVWVGNSGEYIIKVNGSTGAQMGKYSVANASSEIAVDSSGNIWVAGGNVIKFDSSGKTLRTFYPGGISSGITIDSFGNVWVSMGNFIAKLDLSGKVIATYPVIGAHGIAADFLGNIWVVSGGAEVQKISGSTGAVLGTYTVGTLPYNYATGVAVDSSDNIWVTDDGVAQVTKVNGLTGAIIGTYSTPYGPMGITSDASGNVWVINAGQGDGNGSVTKFNSSGTSLGTYNLGPFPTSFGDLTGYALQHIVLGYSGNTAAPTTCTTFTYSNWGTCTSGIQTRTKLTSSPTGCTGGNPVLSQPCSAATPSCTMSFTTNPATSPAHITSPGTAYLTLNSTNTDAGIQGYCTGPYTSDPSMSTPHSIGSSFSNLAFNFTDPTKTGTEICVATPSKGTATGTDCTASVIVSH
jgi:hypothetical protein